MTPGDDGFEPFLWHDDSLHGLHLEVGDPEAGDWRADLILDIDHIVEWVRCDDQRVRFRVAPATLAFRHVTDLRIAVDWGDSGHRTALHPCAIDRIERARVQDQRICLDRPYWRFQIVLNWPAGGEISLGASEFDLALRAAPVLQDEQALRARPGLSG
ncbi:MAG TPA: hypothetical protein VFZ01_03805 [Geminicoccaceae bacterium]